MKNMEITFRKTSLILIHQTNSIVIQTEPLEGITSHQTASISTNLLLTFKMKLVGMKRKMRRKRRK